MPLNEMFRQIPGLAFKSSGSGSFINDGSALVLFSDACDAAAERELVSGAIGATALFTEFVPPAWSSSWRRRRLAGPLPMEMGPVTLRMTRLENEMRSKRDLGPQRILIGQPKTSYMRQLEMTMSFAWPPPKRKTDQRVLNSQLVMVTFWQLPKSAQASSWLSTLQLLMWTCVVLMKWNPSLLLFTRLWMWMPVNHA